jgi:signal recognition particle subunit SRP54
MLVGLYGAGKTTTAGKLAHYYSKRGLKVAAISLDVHRPAAAEQLKQLGQKLNFPVFSEPQEKKANLIWKNNARELDKYDLVFIDTAGRDALDDELIGELKAITKEVKPSETLLVMPADVGQTAKKQTQVFKESTSLTGVIITRMDSTAKAGGALTACAEANVPIVFIGTGEKAHELEQFNPEAFVSRLLGMGDLKGLVEKIESVTNKKELDKTRENLESGKFTLRDLQAQLESMEQIGSFDKVLSMIPGLGKAKIPEEALTSQQEKVKKWKHAINSMTPEEIESPEILEKQTTRMARIAKGSGVSVGEIRSLIKQYRLLKEMIKSGGPLKTEGELDQKTLMKMAKKFGRKMKF